LKIIGESFNIKKYYTVSSVISRMKHLIKKELNLLKNKLVSVKNRLDPL